MATGSRFDNEDYTNWLRATLALLYTKEGLEEFIDSRAEHFHAQLLQSLGHGLQQCITCTSRDIKKDNHHRRWIIACQTCDPWLQMVLQHHCDTPMPQLSPENTNPQLWPTHPWEVLKLFMPFGCRADKSAKDADIQTVLTMFKNCRHYSSQICSQSLVDKLLVVRNALFHTGNFEVGHAELQVYLQKCMDFLQNVTGLSYSNKHHRNSAISKIVELKANKLDISLNKELELKALLQRQTAMDRDVRTLENRLHCLQNHHSDHAAKLTPIEIQVQQQKELIGKLNETKSLFDKFLDANNLREDIVGFTTKIDMLGQQVEEIQGKVKNIQAKLQVELPVLDSYEEKLKYLQSFLIKHYKSLCLVHHPIENEDVELESIFAEPSIKVLRESTGNDGLRIVREPAATVSCKTLFYTQEYRCKQVYITGDAGTGKSTLCKHLVRLWCQAHSESVSNEGKEYGLCTESNVEDMENDVEENYFSVIKSMQLKREEEDREIMVDFKLLFYITLRDSLSEYSAAEMIQSQILQHNEITKHWKVSDLLKNEKCLIIFDGLDEWTCPEGKLVPHFVNPGIPGRYRLNQHNYFLTTSRPWKFDVLLLKSSEVDKHIELHGLGNESASQLCSKVINLLNRKYGCRKNEEEFSSTLREKNLTQFRKVPIILIQLICLWYDNRDLDKSQVQLYCGMLELLLDRAACTKNLGYHIGTTANTVTAKSPLPSCFLVHPYCQRYQQLITALSVVAFEGLLEKKKENSLVFRSTQMEIYGMGKELVSIALNSGILSQNKVIDKCSVIEKKMTFLHKKLQEFLAAVFISSCENEQEVISRFTKFSCTLETMLDMSQVCMFVSGMRPDIARVLLQHMTCVAAADKQVQSYRQTFKVDTPTLHIPDLIKDIQTFVLDCVEEDISQGHLRSGICLKDFLIDKHTISSQLEHLMTSQLSQIKSVYIYTPNMKSCQLPTVHRMMEQLQHAKSLQKLQLFDENNIIPAEMLASMMKHLSQTLSNLALHFVRFSAELLTVICNRQFSLTALALTSVKLTHDDKEHLLVLLPQYHTIRELQLLIRCSHHGYAQCGPVLDLSGLRQTQKLSLLFMAIDNLHVVMDNLEFVFLGRVTIPINTLNCFINSLDPAVHKVSVVLEMVTVTGARGTPADLPSQLRLNDKLIVSMCQYDDRENTWQLHFKMETINL